MGRSPDVARTEIQVTLKILSEKISNAEHLQATVKCNLCRHTVVPGMTVCWNCTGEVVYGDLEIPLTDDYNMDDEDSVQKLAARYIASATGAPVPRVSANPDSQPEEDRRYAKFLKKCSHNVKACHSRSGQQ